MTKPGVEDAVTKASQELGLEEAPASEATDETQVSEPSAKTEEGGEEGSVETSSDSDESAKVDSKDEVKTTDSVQPIVEAKIKQLMEEATRKYGRPQSKDSPNGEAKESLVEKLVEELQGKKEAAKRSGPRDISEVNLTDKVDVQNWVKEVVNHQITEVVSPLAKENALREADLELRKLVTDHPDAHKYGKAMAALLQDNKEMPLEYAYRIASFEANKEVGRQEAYKNMDKKKAATLTQSSAKKPPEAQKSAKNAREAVLKAMEEHGA